MKNLPVTLVVFLTLIHGISAAGPQVFEKSEDGGFVDAEFAAHSIEKRPDGSLFVHAVSHVGVEEVGFQVVVPSKWTEWKPKDFPETLYRGMVTIKSAGKQTEAFVRALARAYRQPVPKFEFSAITLTAISLAGEPWKADFVPVKLKLFCESEKDGEYAEIYLNFDLLHHIVQFHEKDPEYRKAVLRLLSAGVANHATEPAPPNQAGSPSGEQLPSASGGLK